MIYNIENKNIIAKVKNEKIELPIDLKNKIEEHFENIRKSGSNIWNGEILCVAQKSISEELVELICKKSNFAHYLYGERIGCSEEYSCRNLSAGCLMETLDNCYVIGEQDSNTSYPQILTVTGGNIDKKDINNDNIDLMNTIIRETLEELNINLNDKSKMLYNKIKYIYISDENHQPGITVFSKARINMTSKEIQQHFEGYYEYLKNNNLEMEIGRLHLLNKETALDEIRKMKNPKRDWLIPLIEQDINSN